MSRLKTHELRHKLGVHAKTASEIYDDLKKLDSSITVSNPQSPKDDRYVSRGHTIKNSILCERCGAKSYLKVDVRYPDPKDVAGRYNQLAQEFVKLGYDAKVHYYCPDCVKKDRLHLSPIVFTFLAEGMEEPIVSYPDCEKYDDLAYRMALDFLSGVNCVGTMKDIYSVADRDCYSAVGRIIGSKYFNEKNYHDTPREDNRKARDLSWLKGDSEEESNDDSIDFDSLPF